jgi:4-hydroxybenzoyl-CoA thioesterase/acyl-CoA thioester hydrolase
MTAAFRTTRRVEFRDTDAAGIIHFSAFFHYMEEVEHEFLRSRGLSVLARNAEGVVSWPRVAASCQFRGAVRFEDVLDVELRVTRVGAKSVTYAFHFTHAGREVADGEVTAVCCRMQDAAPPRSIAIPPDVLARLAPD